MTDSLERHIAELHLPEPTPGLDRRIDELLSDRPQSKRPKTNGRLGVLALAGGSLAAGILGLAYVPATSKMGEREAGDAEAAAPIVKTLEVSSSVFDLSSTESVNDQDGLFPAGTIVVSTSIQKDE